MHAFPHASFCSSTITTFSAAISQWYAFSHAHIGNTCGYWIPRCMFTHTRSHIFGVVITLLKGGHPQWLLMTVDGTDFLVPQKGTATKGNAFASHKYAGKPALRNELGVSVSWGGTWCGSRVPTPWVSSRISKYLTKFCVIVGPGGMSPGQRRVCRAPRQNRVSPECGESGG